MKASHNDDAMHAAEIVGHLARLIYSDGNACGLTNAQWTALRFFGTATRFSRNLSAFADYHATTRSSASQTINSLVARGFLSRLTSKRDGRSAQIELTEKGKSFCELDPFKNLVQVIETLPNGSQASLAAVLHDVLAGVSVDRQGKKLGICSNCQFFKECIDNKGIETLYFCTYAKEELSELELQQICMNYRAKMSHYSEYRTSKMGT